VFFGWLCVGDRITRYRGARLDAAWASDHPHVMYEVGKRNTIYVAAQARGDSGYDAGAFRTLRSDLILTEEGRSASNWRLPSWFLRPGIAPTLTYHCSVTLWSQQRDFVRLRTVGRGQEFVLDTKDYPEATDWARKIIQTGTS
jgi:hypothetical protein